MVLGCGSRSSGGRSTRPRLLLALGIALLQWPAAAAATRFPVVEGAFAVGHVSLRQNRTEQDYYSVNLRFPAAAVLEHYRRVFAAYNECERRGSGWQAGNDVSVQPPRFVHQAVRHWASPDNRELLTLGLRYYSAPADWRAEPDNDLVRVTVLHERLGDAARAARSQGSSCHGTAAPLPLEQPASPGPLITPR